MKWSTKIGTFAGIDVYVDTTFLMLIAWVALAHCRMGHNAPAALEGVAFVVALFACVVVAIALWLATAAVLALAWRNPARQSPTLSFWLCALWLWNAVAYHAFLFTRINPAAWLFAAFVATESLLFFRDGLRHDVEYFSPMRVLGSGLVMYALIYPLLAVGLVHGYRLRPRLVCDARPPFSRSACF